MQNFDEKYKLPRAPEKSSGAEARSAAITDREHTEGGIFGSESPESVRLKPDGDLAEPKTEISAKEEASVFAVRDGNRKSEPERPAAPRAEFLRNTAQSGGTNSGDSVAATPVCGAYPGESVSGKVVVPNHGENLREYGSEQAAFMPNRGGNGGAFSGGNVPQGFTPSFTAAKKEAKRSSNAIASFVLAIAAMSFGIPVSASGSSGVMSSVWFTFLFEFSFSVAAVAAGAVGVKSKYKGLAVTGLVFGCIILLGILLSMFTMCAALPGLLK